MHLLHVSTTLGHLQVTFFFFKESIALHTLSLVLLSASLYIFVFGYMVFPLPIFCVLLLLCAPLGVPPLGRVHAHSLGVGSGATTPHRKK
jgi:hypothetical protein